MKFNSLIAVILSINILFVASNGNFLENLENPVLESAITPKEAAELLQGFLTGLLNNEVCDITDPTLIASVEDIYNTIKGTNSVFKILSTLKAILPKTIMFVMLAQDILPACKGNYEQLKAEAAKILAKLKDSNIMTKLVAHTSSNAFKMVSEITDLVSGSASRSWKDQGKKLGALIRFALAW